MGRPVRECLINGDRPGVNARNLSFTDAEWDFVSGRAKRFGMSVAQYLVVASKDDTEDRTPGQEDEEE